MENKKPFPPDKVPLLKEEHPSAEAFLNRFTEIAIGAMDKWYQSQAREEKDG